MIDKKYIKEYINFFATSAIRSRGSRLYKNNAVTLGSYDDKTDVYFFRVQGTKVYSTVVKGLHDKNLQVSCTCPYDWGGLCKHSVAALNYLMNNDALLLAEENANDQKKKKRVVVHRKSDDPVVIDDYKNLTYELLEKFTSKNTYNNIFYSDLEIVDFEREPSRIIFKLEKQDPYSYKKSVQVFFELKDDKLYVTSTEGNKVKAGMLRLAEAYSLNYLIDSGESRFFVEFMSEKYELTKKQVTEEYGVKLSDFDKYFKFEITPRGITIVKRKEAFGLLAINTDEPLMTEIISQLEKSSDEQVTAVLGKQEKKLKVGFLIRKIDTFYSDENEYEYVAIYGKPNKADTRLISRLGELAFEKESNILITEEQRNIISLIDDYSQMVDPQKSFSLSKLIFDHLLKEKFVYVAYDKSIGTNNLSRYIKWEFNLSDRPVKFILRVFDDGDFIGVRLKCLLEGEEIDVKNLKTEYSDSKLIFYKNKFYHISNYKDSLLWENFVEAKVVKTHKRQLLSKVIHPLSGDFDVVFDKNTFNVSVVELDFRKKQVYLTEKDDMIIIRLQVVYDNDVEVLLEKEGGILVEDDKSGGLIQYIRNLDLENEFLNEVADLHPLFNDQKNLKFFYISYNDFVKDLWFYKFFEHLSANRIEVFGLKDLKKFNYSPHKGKVVTNISSGQDWFDVNVQVNFGDEKVSLKDIRDAVINKRRYVQLKNGSVGILPEEWLYKLEQFFRNASQVDRDVVRISKLRFSVIDELFEDLDQDEIVKEINEKKKRLKQFTKIEDVKVPKAIKAELRHYQKEGLNWLGFLDEMKWGGILADDMGLGKTLQILTFLQRIVKYNKAPNLIIVPTTLLFNWRKEIEKFAPKLKAFYYYGIDRVKDSKGFKDYHIIFTTYGILTRDIEILRNVAFNYVILDESQAIKNPASRRFKAAMLLKAKNRLALTGTPIENSTFDLYAQMTFVNPGFFGSVSLFKDVYSNPIDRQGNDQMAKELQKLINPFVLRRTKEKVAKELPPKTEDVIYCEMGVSQRRVYDAYRNEYRNKLLNKIQEDGLGKSKIMVLEALTRLRQICDSPLLLNDDSVSVSDSIKINEVITHITTKTANHKVLLFSQFTSMLALIKEELDKLLIPYEYLDGSSTSKQREKSVMNFQTNEELRVFLISLKAGGTGLNLTAADYVYIIDPWWNPAVENQAIDRCYRIGQDKKVFAYRMICKNTIEEKILDLQAKKKKIAGDIIQIDETIMKTLDLNDIQFLFE